MKKRYVLCLLLVVVGAVGIVGLIVSLKRRPPVLTAEAKYIIMYQHKLEGDGKTRYIEEGHATYTFTNTGRTDLTLHMPPENVILDIKHSQHAPDALLDRFDPKPRDITLTPGQAYIEQVDYSATFLALEDETIILKVDGNLQELPVTATRELDIADESQPSG